MPSGLSSATNRRMRRQIRQIGPLVVIAALDHVRGRSTRMPWIPERIRDDIQQNAFGMRLRD